VNTQYDLSTDGIMVVIRSYSKGKLLQESSNEQLCGARERLKKFPILNQIFNNFEEYPAIYYKERKNKVFITCRPRPNGLNEIGYPQLLETLEDSLKEFDINSWQRSSYRDFKKRLTCPDDYYKSEGAVLEIIAAYDAGRIIGFDKLSLHPKLRNGKVGDVLVRWQDKQLFFELTSLTKTKPTQKLEEIFNQLAEYLSGRCISQQYYIKLFVNTHNLKFDADQNIMQEESASYLKSCSDALFLHELAGLTCNIELKTDYSWIKDKKYLLELVGTEYESDLPPNLAELIKSQLQVKQWVAKIKLESISSSPISAVIFNAGRGGNLIEVESEEIYPSLAGLAQERGFQRQLAVKIRDKIDSKQYDEGSPVIIMVKEDTWDKAFFDDDYESIDRIDAIIKGELNKSNWVSGVLIYSSPEDARYIENANASHSIRITQEELVSMGMVTKHAT
jgi:hypothetical protein